MSSSKQNKIHSDEEEDEEEDLEEYEDLVDDGPPTDINPYEVLSLEKNCTPAEVRTSYRKLALLHHPDKAKSEDKTTAHIKFQEIAFAYAILSDEKRRERYDRTGSTSERAVDDDDFDWKSFYKELFEDVVTGETLTQFKESYQGSEEERSDLLQAYTNFSGSLDDIFEHIMLSDPLVDEDRFRKIINEAIESEEVEAFDTFTKETDKSRKTRRKKAEDEGKEAMEYAKKLGVYDKLFGKDEQDEEEQDSKKSANGSKPKRKAKKTTNPEDDPNHPLAALIRDRQSGRMGSFLDNLEAKYTGGPSTTKRKKKRAVADEDDMDVEPNEEEFQAARQRLQSKSSAKAKTSKRSKK